MSVLVKCSSQRPAKYIRLRKGVNRCIVCILLLYTLLVSCRSISENTFVESQSFASDTGSCDSLVCIGNTIYIAEGYYGGEFPNLDWVPRGYCISVIDVRTGEKQVIYDDVQDTTLRLLKSEGEVFCFMRSYENETERHIAAIYELGNLQSPLFQIETNGSIHDTVEDYLYYDNCWYFITENEILKRNSNGVIQTIFTGKERIKNEIGRDHVIIEDRYLYFQDGINICRLNIDNYSMQVLAVNEYDNGTQYHNTYMVLNNTLYYYNSLLEGTMALDCNTWQSRYVSNKRYFYCQYYNNGIIVFEVEDPDAHYDQYDERYYMLHPKGQLCYYKLSDRLFVPNLTEGYLIDWHWRMCLEGGKQIFFDFQSDSYYLISTPVEIK